MSQQNRRGQISRRVTNKNYRGFAPGKWVPQNISAEISKFWSDLAKEPMKVIMGVAAFFVATIIPLAQLIASLFGEDRDGSGGYSGARGGSGSVLGGLQAFLTSTTPLKFVTCMVVCCSIGWSWALLTTWLTGGQNRGRFGVLTIVVSAFCGLVLGVWCTTSLFREGRSDLGFSDSLALLLTTLAIAAAVFLGKARFVSMRELDETVAGRRASALAVFAFSAVIIGVIAIVDRLS
jgi:uncharacterized protein YneF (UPF0154 family)